MVNTLKQFLGKFPTNCLSVFDHFVGLTLKGLKTICSKAPRNCLMIFVIMIFTIVIITVASAIFFIIIINIIIIKSYRQLIEGVNVFTDMSLQ